MSYKDTLDTYLSKEGNSVSALAAAVETFQPNISRYRGGRLPDAEMARKIDKATNGEVPFAIWQVEFLRKSGIAA